MVQVLVTGGGGFLGEAIVKRLVARGDQVTSISRSHYSSLDALDVTQIAGDIADPQAVDAAVADKDLIFHVAAKAGVWGDYEAYYAINVTGTENIINSARKHGIQRIVYTSSPSVVFDGTDQEGWDESAPYPTEYLAAYPQTKAIAEQKIIAANDDTLATVSLRPHLIWGPGDNHLVPRIVERGKAGRIRIVGDPNKLVDSVYVDNAADAHILAADRLHPGSNISGKNYFITNGEPQPMHELVNGILGAAGVPPVNRKVPAGLAYGVGSIMETVFKLLGKKEEPMLTRFVAKQLATAHYYDISAARNELGYEPAVSLVEGFERLAESFRTVGKA